MVEKCEEKTETRGVVITYIDCSIYIYIKTRDSHESNEYGVMNIAIAISSAANPDRHLLQPRPQKKKTSNMNNNYYIRPRDTAAQCIACVTFQCTAAALFTSIHPSPNYWHWG